MSYKVFGGIHDILTSLDELKAIKPNQREKGKMVAVRDGDYRVYIWDPDVTAKVLLCGLADQDPQATPWPSKASMWNPYSTPAEFVERTHMVESEGPNYEDFGYLFVIPDDIANIMVSDPNNPSYQIPIDYTSIPGRWVVVNYATLVDNIPWNLSAGNLIPRYNDKFDIGSAEFKVRDHYVSDNSIWIGDQHKVSIDSTGALKFKKRKKGKIPEHLESHETVSNGQSAIGNVLRNIQGRGLHNSNNFENLLIDDNTSVPSDLDLTLSDWIKLASDSGLVNVNPNSLFGESDFEDALTISSDNSEVTDLSNRVIAVEGMFSNGILSAANIDPEILRNSDFATKFADRMSLESDIVRDGSFGTKFDAAFANKDVITEAGFTTKFAEKMTLETDIIREGAFDARFDTAFGNKDVMTSGGFAANFDSRLSSKDVSDLGDAGNKLLTNSQKTAITTNSSKSSFPGFSSLSLSDVESALGTSKANMLNSNVDQSIVEAALGTTKANMLNSNVDLSSYATSAEVAAKQDAGSLSTEVETYLRNNLQIGGNGSDGTVSLKIGGDIFNSTNNTWLANSPAVAGKASASDVEAIDSALADTISMSAYVANTQYQYASPVTGQTTTAHGYYGSDGITSWLRGKMESDYYIKDKNHSSPTFTSAGNLEETAMPWNLFGNDGMFRGTIHVDAKLSSGGDPEDDIYLADKVAAFNSSIDAVQAALVATDNTYESVPLTDYNVISVRSITSDKDLKNIIRVIPTNEATLSYHLIGLTPVEYEWNEIANTLFGLAGHVSEGFVAEELEQLYPAPDPQNPPTSIDDGHIWWYEHMSTEQLASAENVHSYYTMINNSILEQYINDAIEAAENP